MKKPGGDEARVERMFHAPGNLERMTSEQSWWVILFEEDIVEDHGAIEAAANWGQVFCALGQQVNNAVGDSYLQWPSIAYDHQLSPCWCHSGPENGAKKEACKTEVQGCS